MFQCPNCRAYTDLSAEVDDSNDYEDKEVRESSHEDQATPEEPRSEHEEHQENQENQETQEPQEPQDEPNAPAAPGTGALLSELGTPQPEREQSDRGEPPAPEASRPPSQGLETEAQQPSTNGTNSFEERRPPAAQGSISHPELPLRMTTLSSPSLDEALAISFEGLHLHRTRTATETEDSPNPPEAPSTNGDVPSHSHLDVPGWQSISPHVRQALHRSDTPVRSESSEETNPLTPRNDSGPLAFDGRAGMP